MNNRYEGNSQSYFEATEISSNELRKIANELMRTHPAFTKAELKRIIKYKGSDPTIIFLKLNYKNLEKLGFSHADIVNMASHESAAYAMDAVMQNYYELNKVLTHDQILTIASGKRISSSAIFTIVTFPQEFHKRINEKKFNLKNILEVTRDIKQEHGIVTTKNYQNNNEKNKDMFSKYKKVNTMDPSNLNTSANDLSSTQLSLSNMESIFTSEITNLQESFSTTNQPYVPVYFPLSSMTSTYPSVDNQNIEFNFSMGETSENSLSPESIPGMNNVYEGNLQFYFEANEICDNDLRESANELMHTYTSFNKEELTKIVKYEYAHLAINFLKENYENLERMGFSHDGIIAMACHKSARSTLKAVMDNYSELEQILDRDQIVKIAAGKKTTSIDIFVIVTFPNEFLSGIKEKEFNIRNALAVTKDIKEKHSIVVSSRYDNNKNMFSKYKNVNTMDPSNLNTSANDRSNTQLSSSNMESIFTSEITNLQESFSTTNQPYVPVYFPSLSSMTSTYPSVDNQNIEFNFSMGETSENSLSNKTESFQNDPDPSLLDLYANLDVLHEDINFEPASTDYLDPNIINQGTEFNSTINETSEDSLSTATTKRSFDDSDTSSSYESSQSLTKKLRSEPEAEDPKAEAQTPLSTGKNEEVLKIIYDTQPSFFRRPNSQPTDFSSPKVNNRFKK